MKRQDEKGGKERKEENEHGKGEWGMRERRRNVEGRRREGEEGREGENE